MNKNLYKPEGMIFSSAENRSYIYTQAGLEKAQTEGKILEAYASLCDADRCLYVSLGTMKGIIPKEEALLCNPGETVKDIAVLTRVGKPVCFKVVGFDTTGKEKVAVLSRRLAQQECKNAYLLTLMPGDIIDARITHIEPFGAFADIGCGIIALLPIDCISVSRISSPADRLSVGMDIRVAIKSIDYDTGRIFLTLKELLGTWEENAALFEVGQTVSGIIRSSEPYGIFVELMPNLAGLAEAGDGFLPGKKAAVFIKSIIPEKMKIKLVIVDTYDAPPEVPDRLFYFENRTHIDRFPYSPASCPRVIETVFSE